MNQGLKSYTKQFTHNVSGVGMLSFNMCGAAKNMHMILPLISTVGQNPINLSLIYNEQDKEVSGQFGKGFRLNLFKKLTQTSEGYEVQNADGSVDQYLTSNNYYNEETECSMMFSTDSQGVVHYGIKDRQKNKVNFANFQNDYPESYTNKYNQGIHISMNQGKLDVINNKQEDMIYFYYEGNTITLIYTFNTETTILRKTLLTLADDRITKIQYYEGASTLVGETEIIYELNAIKLKDVISGTITKVDFTTSGTYKVYDGYLNGSSYDYPQYERFQISYTSSKTTVTDAYGDTHTYYFDSNNLLYMEKNYKNEVKYCCFDKETKKLMVVDDIFLANNLASSLSFNITDGSIIGDQGSNVAQVVDDLLWNKLKYINRNGSQRQTLNVNVEPGDVLTFSFWLATYKSPSLNAVKIIVYVGDDSKEYYFKNKEIVELELHSLSYKVKEKLNTIQIEIVTTGTTPIRIGGFQLSTVLFRTNYVYSEHNLVEINNGKDTVQYEYEENGLDLKRTYFNGELVSQNEYNENGTLKRTTNEYGTKKELSYNSIFVNVQETQQKISSSNSVILETKRSFSEDGRYLTKIYNELGEYTKYEYDGLGRIEKAINALNEVLITTYNEGLLSALKLGSLTTNQYEYDERKRLKKVKTGTFSNYEFFYDYKNQITHIKMDGIVILTYTYDSYGNLTRQKYCETGDYYDFEYDNKNRVVGISVNGVSNYEFVYIDDLLVEINDGSRILKEYIYDEQNRLIKVEDNTNDLYMEINNVYNHDSKLTRKSMIVDNKTIHQSFNDFERSSDITFPSVDGVKTIGFVGTQLDIDGQNVMTKFDVYPLHHDANPVDKYKTKPFSLAYKNVGGQEQPKTPFIYDNESGRFVYCANYGTLSYKFGNSTSGTVMARVFKTSLNNEYLFGFIDANGDKIDVYLEASGYMWLFINGNRVVSTQMSFSVNTWHTVGLSYGKSENASSVDTTHTRYYRLFLDGTVKTYSVSSSVEYTTMKTCVGYKEGVSFPFTGYIEMLCFKNAYCEESTLDSLMMAIDTISTKSFIDEFQRINKKEVSKGAINVISNEFTYEKAVILSKTYGTHNVTIEKIKGGNNVISTRYYTYDSLGRVTNITDHKFGNKTYSYNDRGFLENDNGTPITYDENGNIMSYGTDTYTYDSNIKDRLISFNGLGVGYTNTNLLNIEYFKFHNMEYEGKYLKRYTDFSGHGEFEYNEQGLRKKKVWYDFSGNQTTSSTYYYDGDKLVTEIRDSNRLDFLYDEQGLLYSVILNNITKFYYIRDVLQNILGLVDENGNVVVKYEYSAFGKKISIDDTSFVSIGLLNPFRYKGYYYDEETQLYWVSSRYYSPELCRWISPDSIEYLDPESINGLNLYAYCNNNPVNYYDPSGHSALLALGIFALSSLAMWGVSELFGSQIARGIGSIGGGATAISTGISLCAFGPWGIAAGLVLMAVGGLTIAFGANEIVDGAFGTNYIQEWTGWSDEVYNGVYIGLNVASAVGSIAGTIGMRIASNNILNGIVKNPQKIQNYSTKRFGKIASKSSWNYSSAKNGKGMRAVLNDKAIRFNMNGTRFDSAHFYGDPYWVVSSAALGKLKYLYLF